jgi:hypothetical protein
VGEPITGTGESAGYLLLTHGFLQPIASNSGTTNTAPNPPSFPAGKAPYGIDNAGTSVVSGNILLENTLGEWMTTTRSGGAYLLTQGILQPGGVVEAIPLPVIRLEFLAKRISPQQVQLDWKTLQEINNKGFHVERMRQNESSYSVDGAATYSTVQVVQGSKGKIVKLAAYPNPATGAFSVQADFDDPQAKSGAAGDVLEVYDISGRLVQQLSITSGMPVKVGGLSAGIYLVKLRSEADVVQKVVVQ